MSERDTFIRADRELADVIDRIDDAQWEAELPPDFPSFGDRTFTVREIIDYQAYDEAWIPSMMAGRRVEEVGWDAFGEPFGGELLGDDPAARYRELSAAAIDAVQQLPEDELDERVVHFTYGDYPAREALRHVTAFRGLRVHDLAGALGQDTGMSDELVAGLWDMLGPRAEEYRAYGVFGPAVAVPDDAPLRDRLLGLTGRQP